MNEEGTRVADEAAFWRGCANATGAHNSHFRSGLSSVGEQNWLAGAAYGERMLHREREREGAHHD